MHSFHTDTPNVLQSLRHPESRLFSLHLLYIVVVLLCMVIWSIISDTRISL